MKNHLYKSQIYDKMYLFCSRHSLERKLTIIRILASYQIEFIQVIFQYKMSLIRHQSLTNVVSGYKASVYTRLQKNIRKNIMSLICQLHEGMKITAICILEQCEKTSRLLWISIKCMLADDHKDHRASFLLIEEMLSKPQELAKLLKFLKDYKSGFLLDDDGQIEWLHSTIILGQGSSNYPLSCSKQMDDVISQIQSEFNQLLCYPKFQSLKSVDQGKINQFRSEFNKILSKTSFEIQSTFQDLFIESSEVERKSTLSLSVLNEEEVIKPKMPSLSFTEKKLRAKKWALFKKQVAFTEAGKNITMPSQSLIHSNLAFNSDLIEVRFRIKSIVIGCLHLGIVEASIMNIASDLESVGIWGCLYNQCHQKSRMNQENQIIGVPEESVVGILLDFSNDILTIRQWTREKVVELHSKKGCLKKDKQNIFLQSYEQQKLELLN